MSIPIVHLVAGARPNFVKIAPIYHKLKTQKFCQVKIVHTGQHSDINMSDWFFRDLELPEPDYNLEVKLGNHAQTTGNCMIAYETLLNESRPEVSIVVGDVNSTLACAITAKKLNIKVAHLEAGLRSFDMSMPEEINRVLTDRIADLLWTPSYDADDNLIREGVNKNKIFRVGNIMIDSLLAILPIIEDRDINKIIQSAVKNNYALVTFHRPANVDDKEVLCKLVDKLISISKKIKIIFPIHPRTKKKLIEFSLYEKLNIENIKVLEPLGYKDFLALLKNAKLLITDSGGIQEESTYLDIPCLTLRPNTERPITILQGSNQLASIDTLEDLIQPILSGKKKTSSKIELWDGETAERVSNSLQECFYNT